MKYSSNTISFNSLRNYSEVALLSALFKKCCEENFPIAAWQTPQSNKQQVAVQLSELKETTTEIEQLKPGFIVHPFKKEQESSYFIEADLLFSFEDGKIAQAPLYNQQLDKTNDFVQSLIDTMLEPSTLKFQNWCSKTSVSTSDTDYEKLVEKALAKIESGLFRKVVVSRTTTYRLKDNYNPVVTFLKLCKQYPNCFISLLSLPGIGTWITASPETLISIDKNKVFKTIALAATQQYKGQATQDAMWKQKEIEEQALVSRYIINCFKKIRLREYDDIGPKTVIAGNLMHLQTDILVDMVDVNFPELGSTMLKLLHPTSAVCGMPKETAIAFIEENESYDRDLYSGYLGPVNVKDETHLFVNLRCMQLAKNYAVLYAGAGITEGSVPEAEYRETQYKFETLLSILDQ